MSACLLLYFREAVADTLCHGISQLVLALPNALCGASKRLEGELEHTTSVLTQAQRDLHAEREVCCACLAKQHCWLSCMCLCAYS